MAAADTEVGISKDGDGSYVDFFICAVAINVSERGKGGPIGQGTRAGSQGLRCAESA